MDVSVRILENGTTEDEVNFGSEMSLACSPGGERKFVYGDEAEPGTPNGMNIFIAF